MPRKPVERIKVPVANIEATAATQIRLRKDPATIAAYTQDIKDGAVFPAVDVFREPNSERLILADGFHRLHAHVDAGQDEILCNIYEGGMHEALIWALGANHSHGLRLTNADKRNAVQIALKDPEISLLSLREIGDICRVSHMTVARIRNEQQMEEPDSSRHNPDNEKPEEPDEDHKAVKREITQEEVEATEILEACKTITQRSFEGSQVMDRVAVTDELMDKMIQANVWLTDALMVYSQAKQAGWKAPDD